MLKFSSCRENSDESFEGSPTPGKSDRLQGCRTNTWKTPKFSIAIFLEAGKLQKNELVSIHTVEIFSVLGRVYFFAMASPYIIY
jgi:hypothetical protein